MSKLVFYAQSTGATISGRWQRVKHDQRTTGRGQDGQRLGPLPTQHSHLQNPYKVHGLSSLLSPVCRREIGLSAASVSPSFVWLGDYRPEGGRGEGGGGLWP